MEPEVEARFERIESLLHAMAVRENQMEIRFDKQHAQAMQRMDRWEDRQKAANARFEEHQKRFEEHQKRFEEHQKKADRKMEATRKLVEMGMRMMFQLQAQQKETKAEMKELAKAQRAFLDSFRNGGNGHRR